MSFLCPLQLRNSFWSRDIGKSMSKADTAVFWWLVCSFGLVSHGICVVEGNLLLVCSCDALHVRTCLWTGHASSVRRLRCWTLPNPRQIRSRGVSVAMRRHMRIPPQLVLPVPPPPYVNFCTVCAELCRLHGPQSLYCHSCFILKSWIPVCGTVQCVAAVLL